MHRLERNLLTAPLRVRPSADLYGDSSARISGFDEAAWSRVSRSSPCARGTYPGRSDFAGARRGYRESPDDEGRPPGRHRSSFTAHGWYEKTATVVRNGAELLSVDQRTGPYRQRGTRTGVYAARRTSSPSTEWQVPGATSLRGMTASWHLSARRSDREGRIANARWTSSTRQRRIRAWEVEVRLFQLPGCRFRPVVGRGWRYRKGSGGATGLGKGADRGGGQAPLRGRALPGVVAEPTELAGDRGVPCARRWFRARRGLRPHCFFDSCRCAGRPRGDGPASNKRKDNAAVLPPRGYLGML